MNIVSLASSIFYGDSMKKAKMFLLKHGLEKGEAEVNDWLAQNAERKILSSAGLGSAGLVIIYEE